VASSEVSNVYAGALLDLAQEKGIVSKVEEEISFVAELAKSDKDLMLYLNSPGISGESKKAFIDKVFSGELSEIIVNFLKILIDNDRQDEIPSIYDSMVDLIDDINNRQRVSITTSSKLDDNLKKKIVKAMEEKLNKSIIIDEIVDESILGGIVIKIDDLVIDGSLVKDLKNMREKLINSKVRSEVAYED